MTLSEYLIEAVARRTTGKYDFPGNYPDTNWKELVSWLDEKGFTNEEKLSKFDSNNRSYNIGSTQKDGTPYYVAVHVDNMVFNMTIETTRNNRGSITKVKMFEKDSTDSSGNMWIGVGLDYFVNIVQCNS